MAARATMQTLVNRVRAMIGDDGSTQTFSDDQIQTELDRYKQVIRYGVLLAQPFISSGGALDWCNFYSGYTDWEDAPASPISGVYAGDGTQLYGPSFTLLAPTSFDPVQGRWFFNVAVPGQLRPVYVVGATYDPYMAAGQLCLQWAARLARSYTIKSGNQLINREQMSQGLRASAKDFFSQAKAIAMPMARSDVDMGLPFAIGDIDPTLW